MESSKVTAEVRPAKTTLQIEGMSCATCVNSVENAIATVYGVKQVNVNLATGEALIRHNARVGDLIKAVNSSGYSARIVDGENKTVKLRIEGMSCASCVSHVERALAEIPGASEATVNLAAGSARVDYSGSDVSELVEAVGNAGYRAALELDDEEMPKPGEKPASSFKIRFLIALPLTLVVMVMDMGPMLISGWHELIMGYLTVWNSILLVLTGFVLFYTGSSFFTGAWKALKRKTADMNTLIAVGTGAAFFFSAYATFFGTAGGLVTPMDVYFDTAAVIIALVLLGRWMEERAKLKSKDALTGLLEMTPQQAHRIENGDIATIDLKDVRVGDVILVKGYEQVPVDGVLLDDTASIDESMMTGESLPVEKTEKDAVVGATRNTAQSFRMEATRVGADTAFAGIIETVKDAQGSKPPIQRLVDKLASVFVPVVIVIALITLGAWLLIADPAVAIVNMVAVLVIACPCALGLATPTGMMVGSGRAAQKGILIKDAVTLEEAKSITTIIFDKTGTLTTGKMKVTGIAARPGFNEDEVLSWAAAVEKHSDHPIAASVTGFAKEKELAVPQAYQVETQMGTGMTGIVNGTDISIGSSDTFGDYSPEQLKFIEDEQDDGKTVLIVKAGGNLAAYISVADTMKDGVPEIIRNIKNMGIEPVMVTGDQERTALAVARQAGIDQVESRVSPDGKAAIVKKYQDQGEEVAMVGDGINDAAALVQADLGIAMSTGTDLAVSSSDITLLGGDLSKVAEAITLSKGVLRIIRQNLFWAFVYNSAGIPLAAFGFLSPIFAAAAMALSSVSVVANSLRIRRL